MNKFQPNSRHIGCFSPQFLYNSTKQTSLSIFAEILNDRKHSEGTKNIRSDMKNKLLSAKRDNLTVIALIYF